MSDHLISPELIIWVKCLNTKYTYPIKLKHLNQFPIIGQEALKYLKIWFESNELIDIVYPVKLPLNTFYVLFNMFVLKAPISPISSNDLDIFRTLYMISKENMSDIISEVCKGEINTNVRVCSTYEMENTTDFTYNAYLKDFFSRHSGCPYYE